MMGSADILRRRAALRGRTASVDCGELGSVTVEALPIRELQLLLRGPEPHRSIFYAACRELQLAGQEQFRERMYYSPSGIMDYVSDSEARVAAEKILELSGWSDLNNVYSSRSSPEAKNQNNVYSSLSAVGDEAEIRPESVQKNEEDFSQIRPASVQMAGEADGVFSKIRPASVQILPGETGMAGQVSRETAPVLEKNFDASARVQKPQGIWENRILRTQNVVPAEFETGNEAEAGGADGGTLHESKSEFGGGLHETKSELSGKSPSRMHETESEVRDGMHETESDFAGKRGKRLHEGKSEFAAGLHEIKSETGRTLHETKSESAPEDRTRLHETTSELAEAVARELLSGLRRANWVRGG